MTVGDKDGCGGSARAAGDKAGNSMDIEKTIADLPERETGKLKDLLANADRVLGRQPLHPQAARLRAAIIAELADRRISNRIRVGQLWWEPHDPDLAEFPAYTEARSTTPVAAIFKRATHTATRKEVYSVRIGDHALAGQFSEVALARRAGSDAWEKRKPQESRDFNQGDEGRK
jgi:hypothetical protein